MKILASHNLSFVDENRFKLHISARSACVTTMIGEIVVWI